MIDFNNVLPKEGQNDQDKQRECKNNLKGKDRISRILFRLEENTYLLGYNWGQGRGG